MTTESESHFDPAERTREFFSGNQEQIGTWLPNKVIVVAGSRRKIIVRRVKSWIKTEITPPFRKLKEHAAGEFVAYGYRGTTISHIVTRDRDTGEDGTCIAIEEADLYHPETNDYIAAKSMGEVAKHLGLGRNENGHLKFLDQSDTLYLFGTNVEETQEVPTEMTPNEFIDDLTHGI